MSKPWKDIDAMDHDELRRFARDLVKAWVTSPPDDDVSELVLLMNRVGRRMEAVGISPHVKLTVDETSRELR